MSTTLHVRARKSWMPWYRYRYAGFLWVEDEKGKRYRLPMPGTIAQWIREGEELTLTLEEPEAITYTNYRLEGKVPIWPVWEATFTLERHTALSETPLYTYTVVAREAVFASDYEAIVDLEQHHYASDEDLLAWWYCDHCHVVQEANLKPQCPKCGQPMHFHDLKSATRASRFLVLQLVRRAPYEPRIVGYVRVDPPLPLMHRLLPDGSVEKHIREKVFPPEWFAYPFRPPAQKNLEAWWMAQGKALEEAQSPVARLARVVIHPDYRSDGLGQLALRILFRWMEERWVPDMRVPKAAVETVAMMARYNPFMEKVGFRYMWDTASGRPTLYYPLTEQARTCIETFLQKDETARQHGGSLYRARYRAGEPLQEPIRLENIAKAYTYNLDLEAVSGPVRDLLEAFGVQHRVIQKVVLRNVNMIVEPGQIVVLMGASGSGKTTLLRILAGAALGLNNPLYRPDHGTVHLPENTRAGVLLPGELEPHFGDEPLAQVLFNLTGDEAEAVEILNLVGIADVVLYRAPFAALSTGQKARAYLAYLLAQRPNLLLVDEFAAHLDPATAQRLARKLARLAREQRMTLILVLHRHELLSALEPDAIYIVGYGTFWRWDTLPERGFRVKEPYASYIVQGKKRWELRKHPTRVRGRVAVIHKDQVLGTVEIRNVHGPFTVDELLNEHYEKHLAHPEFLRAYAQGRPLYAWELEEPVEYPQPRGFQAKQGQQLWIRLDKEPSAEPPRPESDQV